ncbi:MAG: hypothetical protein IPP46_20090 [Bacteroidetes bacterium]|nr:hypothetical protein [Bacteroidota bacterium]
MNFSASGEGHRMKVLEKMNLKNWLGLTYPVKIAVLILMANPAGMLKWRDLPGVASFNTPLQIPMD